MPMGTIVMEDAKGHSLQWAPHANQRIGLCTFQPQFFYFNSFIAIARSSDINSASYRLGCVPALSQPSYLAAAGRRIVA